MKNALQQGQVVPLMEAFYTIQGEGYHKGSAAYFIRIGGCDVGCHWCDVKESWDAEKHPPTEISAIIQQAKQYSDTIVVTGGEPLMWNMGPLTHGLQNEKLATHIETSGAYPLSGHWDWICLSPKKQMLPLDSTIKLPMNSRSLYITKAILLLPKSKLQKYSPIVNFTYNRNGANEIRSSQILWTMYSKTPNGKRLCKRTSI